MNLMIKNLKINKRLSEETLCFSATLYVDGKKAGEVGNRGNGGCNFYHWIDPQVGYTVTNWAKEQKTEFNFEQLDQVVDKLIATEEVRQQFVRWTKKGTVFFLVGEKDARTITASYTEEVAKFLRTKYGEKLELIVNHDIEKAVKKFLEKKS